MLNDLLSKYKRVRKWCRQTDRVIDAYKTEVEMLRKDVRLLQTQVSSLVETILLKN